MVCRIANVKVKANAHYICQECGATELIQAHHQIRGDDNSLIVLCAICHSKRHPNVPLGLFFSRNHQPYWYNKSAASLAREVGVCSRTIIRYARKLGIERGELTDIDEQRLRMMKEDGRRYAEEMEQYITEHREKKLRALKANYDLLREAKVVVCPECGSGHMHKFGWKFVLRIKQQQYQCQNCGRITLKPNVGE